MENINYNDPEVEEITDEEAELNSAIEAVGTTLLRKRDEAVSFRAASGVEDRWREDQAAFDTLDAVAPQMIDYATGEAPLQYQKEPRRSKVVVNIIRSKCETAEGRFSDIQLPVDDKNWGLKITPVPMMSDALKDDRPATVNGRPVVKDGEPLKVQDVAQADIDSANAKMDKMETEIDDQLTECKFNAEQRKLIRAAARLGTGILSGPNVVKQVKKTWTPAGKDGVYELTRVENRRPASKEVSCWNIFPDPDCEEDVSRAAYIWERDGILARELRDLHGLPGYFDDKIVDILMKDPIRTKAAYDDKKNKHYVLKQTMSAGSLYEKWTYTGDLNRDDLEALGVDVSHDMITQNFSANVVFVNDVPIKVQLNPLDTGDMPYDFFQWTQVAGSPWGIGLSQIMKWFQRILIAAWRAMMDNLGDSSGANIVISSKLVPADGVMEITGKKIWEYLDDDDPDQDVRKAFAQFQVQNNQAELQAVIDLALKFIDMETSLPMLFQGEKAEAPETLGATNIMVDANNVALRSRVKIYDDYIITPHITRYYDWNMQYNPNAEIKGDYCVDARGTSVLLEKDQQAKTLMGVMAAKQDPDVRAKVDWEKATEKMLKSMKLGDILKSPEEYENFKKKMAEQGPPPDPAKVVAEIKVKGELEKVRLTQEADAAKIKAKAEADAIDAAAKAREAELERQHELRIKTMELQMKQMELSQATGISLDKIKAGLMTDAAKINLQRELSENGRKADQVVEPVAEPPQRAEPGKAFQD